MAKGKVKPGNRGRDAGMTPFRGEKITGFEGGFRVGRFLSSFKEFPPRQRPGSFTIDQALEAMQSKEPNVS